jgi:hypothetical protein
MTTKTVKTLGGILLGLGLAYNVASAQDVEKTKYQFNVGASAFASSDVDNVGIKVAAKGFEPGFNIKASKYNLFGSFEDRLQFYNVNMGYGTDAKIGEIDGSKNDLTALVGATERKYGKFFGALGYHREDNTLILRPEGFNSIAHNEVFEGPTGVIGYDLEKGSAAIKASLRYSPLNINVEDIISELDITNKTSGKGYELKGILGAEHDGLGINLELAKKIYDLNGKTDVTSSRFEVTAQLPKNFGFKLHFARATTKSSTDSEDACITSENTQNQVGMGITYKFEK